LPRIPRRELIHHAVQAALKDFMVDQRLQAGDPLPPEGQLARELGVSRTSVREAVKALESLGIIEARAGSGLYVRQYSLDAVLDQMAFGMLFNVGALKEILDIRLIIESGMVERVLATVTDAQVALLQQILTTWGEAAARGEYPAQSDRAFHAALYESDDNPLVGKVLDAFWRVFYEARSRAMVAEPLDPAETFELHVAILRSIESRDVDGLRAALAAHHEGIRRRVAAAAAADERSRGEALAPVQSARMPSSVRR
jgi:DNA-binding FadR family transcriptional regulator